MTISQHSSDPLFFVLGATGLQGISVLNAIKEDRRLYRIRAITRNAISNAAKERAEWECEVMVADVANVDDMARAFAGAQFVFAMVTPGWLDQEVQVEDPFVKEYIEGKNDDAHAAGVKTFIWSGLPSLSKISGGKYPVSHCDAKAAVTEYARRLEGPDFKVYNVQPGMYTINYLGWLAPRKSQDGTYAIPYIVDKPKPTALSGLRKFCSRGDRERVRHHLGSF